MKFFKFFFLKLLIIFFILFFLYFIFYFLFDGIKNYTQFQKEVQIPIIRNFNIIDAIILLESHNLSYEIDSFKYDSAYKKLQVLYVFPEEKSYVKKGRKLFIRSNPRYIPLVILPNLININKYLGISKINTLGLNIRNIIYKNSIRKDKIIQMFYKGKKIKYGDLIPKYSKIDLVIG